jgi:adenylosuccinate synthase
MLNGATQIALTKLDIVYQECRGVSNYRDLPPVAKGFIKRIEDETRVPVTLIGTGPAVEEVVDRRATI